MSPVNCGAKFPFTKQIKSCIDTIVVWVSKESIGIEEYTNIPEFQIIWKVLSIDLRSTDKTFQFIQRKSEFDFPTQKKEYILRYMKIWMLHEEHKPDRRRIRFTHCNSHGQHCRDGEVTSCSSDGGDWSAAIDDEVETFGSVELPWERE